MTFSVFYDRNSEHRHWLFQAYSDRRSEIRLN
jgi:hypothetical protein